MHCIMCVLLDSFLRQRNMIHHSILIIGMECDFFLD